MAGSFEGAAGRAAITVTLLLVDLSFEPSAKERQLCREAVDTVLTTKDPLELERAKFLVEQPPGCGMRP
jgi:hypothetical protein